MRRFSIRTHFIDTCILVFFYLYVFGLSLFSQHEKSLLFDQYLELLKPLLFVIWNFTKLIKVCVDSLLQPQLVPTTAPVGTNCVWPCQFSLQGRENECVCLCDKHTWCRRRPITPPFQQPTLTPHPTASSFSTLHPNFFPSQAPEGGEGSMTGADDVTLGDLRF